MINILDELKDINVGEDELIQDRLTPEQIELEKKEFADTILLEEKAKLKNLIAKISKIECSQRLNGKTHYISKVCYAPSVLHYLKHDKVQIYCEFCGQLDYVYILNNKAYWEKNLQEGLMAQSVYRHPYNGGLK